MKKSVLLFALVAGTFIASAQTGSWYVGGVLGLVSNASENAAGNTTTSTDWAFGPEGGTFLRDDIQLGAFLGIGGGKTKDDNGDISKYSTFSPTIYSRKFFKITDNFSTFAGAYINIATGSSTSYFTGGSVTTDYSGFGISLGIGVAYALSPRFTAVGQYGLLGYHSTNDKVNGSDAGGDTSFGFGVNTVGYSALGQGNGSGAVFNVGIYYTIKTSE
jgi:hypothetical protein